MFKYVTFNIRYDCERDGRNQFVYRQPLILCLIRSFTPLSSALPPIRGTGGTVSLVRYKELRLSVLLIMR